MNDSIWVKLQKLEKSKEEILNFLDGQESENLLRSKGDSWSMIQAMRHVQMSEDSIIGYLEKKIQAGDSMLKENIKGRLSLLLLSTVFFLRIKFKAPAAIANPPETSLGELKEDWNTTRIRMTTFISGYPEKWKKKAIYRHPLGFRISLKRTVGFFNVHLRHHIHQVHRINKSLLS